MGQIAIGVDSLKAVECELLNIIVPISHRGKDSQHQGGVFGRGGAGCEFGALCAGKTATILGPSTLNAEETIQIYL